MKFKIISLCKEIKFIITVLDVCGSNILLFTSLVQDILDFKFENEVYIIVKMIYYLH